MTKHKLWSSKYQRQAAALLCGLCLLSSRPSFVWAVDRSPTYSVPHSSSPSGKLTVSHKAPALPPPVRAKGPGSQRRHSADNTMGGLEMIAAEAPGLRGKASFYGQRFSGRMTANGERFESKLFTGASNRFALGSSVLVQRLDNERCAIVKINDRMHARHRQRVIDVSRAVAEYLDMVRAGVVLVRVVAIKAGASETNQGDCPAPAEAESVCLDCEHKDKSRPHGQPQKLPDFSPALVPPD